MKVLITGGAGFIGSHLAERLLEKGDKIFVIDNYSTGRRDNLKSHRNLTVIEGSIIDSNLVDKLFDEFKPEQVVHAAASYKDPENWLEDAMTNVVGTINVVKASQRIGVKRIIYFQTSLCYGLQPTEQPITLDHPLFSGKYAGGSSYAISKTAAEQYIELGKLDFISFRLANVYGPRNISGPLPTFFNRLINNRPCFAVDTRRDFIYVSDVIDVVIKALDGKGSKGYYHISSGSDYSIKELFDAAAKATGIKIEHALEIRPRNADDAFTILLDAAKTNKDFGWKPKVSLTDGVRTAIEWYKTNTVGETYTHLKIKI